MLWLEVDQRVDQVRVFDGLMFGLHVPALVSPDRPGLHLNTRCHLVMGVENENVDLGNTRRCQGREDAQAVEAIEHPVLPSRAHQAERKRVSASRTSWRYHSPSSSSESSPGHW